MLYIISLVYTFGWKADAYYLDNPISDFDPIKPFFLIYRKKKI